MQVTAYDIQKGKYMKLLGNTRKQLPQTSDQEPTIMVSNHLITITANRSDGMQFVYTPTGCSCCCK